MKKSILIIDNHDSFTYNLVDLLHRFSYPVTVCQVEKINFAKVYDYSHILISPGPDVPKSYPNLFRLVSEFKDKKNILGVCLGHQMLCEYFGGHLYNLEQVRHGQNAVLVQCASSQLWHNIPNRSVIGLYHSWAVSEVDFPDELQITAHCEQGIVMAMEHRKWRIFGVQFHPESIITTHGEAMLYNWLNID